MKINWGTGITIAIISFMSFILYFVISMGSGQKHNLVTEKYYQKELMFQQEMDALRNGKELPENIKVVQVKEGLKVFFPKEFDANKITGKIVLYRPSNKRLDFEIPVLLSENYMIVPKKNLLVGRWNLTVSWKYEEKEYLFKKELMY